MRKILPIFFIWIFFLVACEKKSSSPPSGKPESPSIPKVVVEKEKVEKGPPPPPEVKIRLKKESKDTYSWELTGSDVDQILKVNEKLRRQLGGDQSK